MQQLVDATAATAASWLPTISTPPKGSKNYRFASPTVRITKKSNHKINHKKFCLSSDRDDLVIADGGTLKTEKKLRITNNSRPITNGFTTDLHL